MNRPSNNTKPGFSLIEIMAVVAILSVLAGMVISRISVDTATTKKTACYVSKGEIEVQVQRFFRNQGSWPQTSLSDMIPPGTSEYFPEGLPTCPVDGTPYTIDSVTHEVVGHTH